MADAKEIFDNMSGFGWSPITKMFEAEPEVWERLCQEKPSASKYRRLLVNNYDKLVELYSEQRARGDGAISGFERVQMWNASPQFDIDLNDANGGDDTPTFPRRQGSAYSGESLNAFTREPSPSINSHGTSSSRGLKRKTPMTTLASHQFEDVSASIKSMVEMLDACNKFAERSSKELIGAIERGNSIQEHQRERIYHANEIYAELEKLDLPETLLDQAYKFFVGNRQQTSMMFGLPERSCLRFVMNLSNKPSFWMNDD